MYTVHKIAIFDPQKNRVMETQNCFQIQNFQKFFDGGDSLSNKRSVESYLYSAYFNPVTDSAIILFDKPFPSAYVLHRSLILKVIQRTA